MIADWTVDVAADAPTIDIPWEGWVDLRWDDNDPNRPWRPEAVRDLSEVQAYPELLGMLKAANRAVRFTSKVDVFPISRDEVDPEVAEAGDSATRFGLASYLDLATNALEGFHQFDQFEADARLWVANLRKIELASPCSVEVVVRGARCFEVETFGWTLYAMGFGPTLPAAREAWSATALALVEQVTRRGPAWPSQARPIRTAGLKPFEKMGE